MKILFFLSLVFFSSVCVTAQNVVTRDSTGAFFLSQGRQTVPLDTAQIRAQIQQGTQNEKFISEEITLLQQIVERKRQQAAIIEERRALVDVLNQARKLKNPKP